MKKNILRHIALILFQLMIFTGCGPRSGTDSDKDNPAGNNNSETDNNDGKHANTLRSPAGTEYPGSAGSSTLTDSSAKDR